MIERNPDIIMAEDLIYFLIFRLKRHIGNFDGFCLICGCIDNIEVHHLRVTKDIENERD